MRALQRSAEWLRPLVDSMAWDYAVVWKLVGDGPSGFVEWVGCCCCGGGPIFDGVKEEKQEDDAQLRHSTTPICRDHRSQHPMRTRACLALALYPSSFPLCSGIHGEVVISSRPRWISKARSASDANFVQEFAGTSVLVPVVGGIVELFSAKLMPKEPHKIEIIRTWSRFLREAVNAGICDLSIDEFLIREYFKFYPSPLQLSSLDSGLQQLPTGTQSSNNPEGSSSSPDLTHDYPSFDPYNILGYLSQAVLMKQSVLESTGSKNSKSLLKQTNFSGCNAAAAMQKGVHKQGGGKCEAKNLVTERKRRTRIKERLYTLRSLVPKISKMDMTSILGDAAEYIEDLQMEVRKLGEELEELEKEVCRPKDTNSKSRARSVGHDCSKSLARQQVNQESSRLDLKTETKAQVEVNQIGKGDFLVKIVMLQKQRWFSRMMEGIHSLGYTVVNANITTLNGKVLANLILELRDDGVLPKNLRESLMQLASLIGQ
ncbi:transcription factor bHLH90-like isoform X2 [Rhodamnia argentea]|uniref:Transcription factor bHLH90-like isoform X2 n=1 Tax=Rhodamnia argentea TaxID=178133 RepID=A0A8B8N325_9MYRT|nr:transcription factor bHLH90-like isoform X2 [Rhodamnia argentea]